LLHFAAEATRRSLGWNPSPKPENKEMETTKRSNDFQANSGVVYMLAAGETRATGSFV
jgi:hypothetical protein